MARTVCANGVLVVQIMVVLGILGFFLNLSHFNNTLNDPQCSSIISQKDSQIQKLVTLMKYETEKCVKNQSSVQAVPPTPFGSVHKDKEGEYKYNNESVIPVLVISCNRAEFLKQTLLALLRHRPSARAFPIIVSQDCDSPPVEDLLKNEFGDEVVTLRHYKTKQVEPYFAIAQHYGWALTQIFTKLSYKAVIIVEDDMEVAVDFFEYFMAVYPIMKADRSIYCASSWNDNGLEQFIRDPAQLYRSDFFPGLGWMMISELWDELGPKWPEKYWDEFMREPRIRKERVCIRPEISRNRNIGKKGVSTGQFYETHIKRIVFNTEKVKFTDLDLSYLIKENYDPLFLKSVHDATLVTWDQLIMHEDKDIRIIYRGIEDYKRIAHQFGIMNDEKEGIPRTAYKGVVTFHYETNRIFLTPPTVT